MDQWVLLHELYTWDWRQPQRMHHKIAGMRADATQRACDRHSDYYSIPRSEVHADCWRVIP